MITGVESAGGVTSSVVDAILEVFSLESTVEVAVESVDEAVLFVDEATSSVVEAIS